LRLVLLCTLVAVSACAHRQAAPDAGTAAAETLEIGGATFHLEYASEDADAARQVARALALAVPVAGRWGKLGQPVRITIHPTHRALEQAARRLGYAWLRAWARYASIDLQSPRTWSRGSASDAAMAQLLAHELTHCVMYQSAGSEEGWASRRIPLWFREGMASVTAGEEGAAATAGARPPRPADTEALAAPAALYRDEAERVYSTARDAFRAVLRRAGDDGVRRVIAVMRAGRRFPEAFEQALGIPLEAFEADVSGPALSQG
jgi:hypothetical protein